jgi:hypothetical protein
MGFLGGGALVLAATPRHPWFEAGTAVAALGVAWRLWASGCLRKNESVARDGPYRVVRHPLYLGSLLLWAGLCGMAGNPWFAAVAALGFAVYHVRAVRREEAFLVSRFGAAYEEFRRAVPAVVPTPGSLARLPGALASGGFSLALAWKHREWHVALATGLLHVALHHFTAHGQPPAWRWGAAAGLAVAAAGRLALFALLDREVQNPVLAAVVALLSRKKRRERARRSAAGGAA